jgi:hypothetical protein
VTDTLLFLHLLSAAALFVAVVIFSSYAVGAPVDRATFTAGRIGWIVGAIGVLVFGVWLALRIDGYELWDAWVLIALALWFLSYGAGETAEAGAREALEGGSLGQRAVAAHWVRTALVLLLLADMVWKPWA